jgi:hypothetical protein
VEPRVHHYVACTQVYVLPSAAFTCHPQVAERSLFLWNHEYIITLVAQYRQAVLPIVFGALEENANNHWNPAVHGLTCNVRKMFMVSAALSFRLTAVVGWWAGQVDGSDSSSS